MTNTLSPSNTWVDKYGDALFRYCITRVPRQEQAEDLVQETFLAAIKSQSNFQGKSTEKTWLIAILKHKIMDFYRKNKREVAESELSKDSENLQLLDALFDENSHLRDMPRSLPEATDSLYYRKQLQNHIQTCINTLPERFKNLFVLKEIDNLSSQEIQEQLGITPSNIWVSMHRSRSMLRSCLNKYLDAA